MKPVNSPKPHLLSYLKSKPFQPAIPFLLFVLVFLVLPTSWMSDSWLTRPINSFVMFWPKIRNDAALIQSTFGDSWSKKFILLNLTCAMFLPVWIVCVCRIALQNIHLEWNPRWENTWRDSFAMSPMTVFLHLAVLTIISISFVIDFDIFSKSVGRGLRLRKLVYETPVYLFWYAVWYGAIVSAAQRAFLLTRLTYVADNYKSDLN